MKVRKLLKSMGTDKRYTFTAIVERFSLKNGFRNLPLRTILLTNVRYEGKLVADHVWLTCGRRIYSAVLIPGDLIQLDARIKEYEKGYKGRREDVYKPISRDYCLSYPTKIKVLTRGYKKESNEYERKNNSLTKF